MKKILIALIAVVLTVGIGGWSFAYETDFDDLHRFDRSLPAWKFGRGVVNLLSGPYELIANMTNNAINGAYEGAYDGGLQGYLAGSANGIIAGLLTGTITGARRMTTGAMEILTFWKPEYGPTMEPHWGTRNRAGGDRDFFDPNPFWYNGPDRN